MASIWSALRRLSLGLILIAAASAVLLLSDRAQRVQAGPRRVVRLAIVQHASTPVLDAGVQGVVQGLAEQGFRDGETLRLTTYNAHGDLATGNAIARQVTTGEFDMVITSSTPSMQAVANANRDGRVMHVFTLVADPFSAGVGLDRDHPLTHPRRLLGQGSFLPVDESFALARQALPGLTRVGVAWNPAESNSEAFTRKAREACRAQGLTLLEANVDSSAAVTEAIQSLVARGAQALWIGGDNTMTSTIGSVVATTRAAHIPVFTIVPGAPDRGTLFDVGLDFRELGRLGGRLAGEILKGADPAAIPIRDVLDEVPRELVVNATALAGLKEPWRLPDDVRAKATVLVDERGIHRVAVRAAAPLAKKWRVNLIQLNQVVDVEESQEGVLAGFKESGLVEGRDYEITVRNAQGDMATVSALVDAALSEHADLLVTFSTPTLQAALQRARGVPIVFTYVSSAVAAGAGTSDTQHLPNVTGVYMLPSYDDMLATIRHVVPSARRVGTLFVPAEVNSVLNRDLLEAACRKAGLALEAVPANTSVEVADAGLALAARRPDVICQIPGNLTAAAFPTLQQAALRARLPIFAFQSSQAGGAVLTMARDYRDAGRQSAGLAVRVMRGETPAGIPFQTVGKTRLIVNLGAARRIGLTMPADVVSRADTTVDR
jgi:ABC-type uncharacterized transport system substrate-binding protein